MKSCITRFFMNQKLSDIRVQQHTIFINQGGTAKIAELINQGLVQKGWDSRLQGEIDARIGAKTGPTFTDSDLLHIHSTLSWAATLEKCHKNNIRPYITLHDVTLLTGGCTYPLECTKWKHGCPECHRGYHGSSRTCEDIRHLVATINPVLISPSEWLGKMARQAFPGQTVHIVPNGVKPDVTEEQAMNVLHNFCGRIVLFVAHGGTDAGYKSGDKWLSIWSRIKKKVPEARALFIGNRQANKSGDVLELPYLPNEAVRGIMQQADVLVYPSMADNHPLVVLEAMMSKLPVVAFAVGGISEQIRHDQTGILVRPGDYEELASQAAKLLKHPAQAKAMARRARQVALDNFNVSRMVEDYTKIYEQA
ncbi:glycosyltransferase [Desulfonatronovibrio magnus]|uniref:glycosyltransferase n=1 Tax=Desulfonatronovibrio magnus TaxID=698827 RepID=UPI000698B47A|nr:glycosyltransferase [Desulfonatronovibrio magnus]